MDVKPILFNTEMVRAILDGKKTQTRRAIRPQPLGQLCYIQGGCGAGRWHYIDKRTAEHWDIPSTRVLEQWINDRDELDRLWTPPCHADDLLWVRETWNYGFWDSDGDEAFTHVWFEPDDYRDKKSYNRNSDYIYKADGNENGTEGGLPWRPSIHMPKEAARIWLQVKNVRVEKLHDMTVADACAEGAAAPEAFPAIWDSTVSPGDSELYGFKANPWVWVIEFERTGKHHD